jgi:hypothetical protein
VVTELMARTYALGLGLPARRATLGSRVLLRLRAREGRRPRA